MKGFTLVEMLVSLLVFTIAVGTIGMLIGNLNRFSLLSSNIDKSYEDINYTHRIIDIVSDVVARLGRHIDEISISDKSISGKIFVLNNSVDATLVARTIDYGNYKKLELVFQTPTEEKILLEVKNADVSFRLATEYSDDLGAMVELTVTRWIEEETGSQVVREILVPMPLVSVR